MAQPADGGIAHHLANLLEQGQLIGRAADGLTMAQPAHQLFLPGNPHPAGHTLATGFVTEEGGDARQGVAQIGGIVENHHHARAQ